MFESGTQQEVRSLKIKNKNLIKIVQIEFCFIFFSMIIIQK